MEKLSLFKHDGLHTWGIEFQSQDEERVEQFVYACRTNLDRRLGAFHQSGLRPDGSFSHYQYFEFLQMYNTKDLDDFEFIYEQCKTIASVMDAKLENAEKFDAWFA